GECSEEEQEARGSGDICAAGLVGEPQRGSQGSRSEAPGHRGPGVSAARGHRARWGGLAPVVGALRGVAVPPPACPRPAAPSLVLTMTHANPYGPNNPYGGRVNFYAESFGDSYTIQVTNDGSEVPEGTGVKVIEQLPKGVVFVEENNGVIRHEGWRCNI